MQANISACQQHHEYRHGTKPATAQPGSDGRAPQPCQPAAERRDPFFRDSFIFGGSRDLISRRSPELSRSPENPGDCRVLLRNTIAQRLLRLLHAVQRHLVRWRKMLAFQLDVLFCAVGSLRETLRLSDGDGTSKEALLFEHSRENLYLNGKQRNRDEKDLLLLFWNTHR